MALYWSTTCLLASFSLGFARRQRVPPLVIPVHSRQAFQRLESPIYPRIHTTPDDHATSVSSNASPLVREQRVLALEKLRGGGSQDASEGSEEKKKLKPFPRGRTSIVVTRAIEKVLAKGNVWQLAKVSGSVCMGQAVMDVEASPSVVWSQLLDFASYPKKAPKLRTCQVYGRKVERGKDVFSKVERIHAKFVSPVVPGVKMIYHIDHSYEPAKNSITWTLDDEKKNDFIEIQGHWHVKPNPKDSSKARVFYEIGTVVPRWFPKWLKDKLTKKVILDATSWVKKFSELAAKQ